MERDKRVEPCLFQHGGRLRSSTACVNKFSFCALCVHIKKKRQHAVWVIDYLRKRETFGCYNSLFMSDLVNHKAIWSNYMRNDIEMFDELISLVETQI